MWLHAWTYCCDSGPMTFDVCAPAPPWGTTKAIGPGMTVDDVCQRIRNARLANVNLALRSLGDAGAAALIASKHKRDAGGLEAREERLR